MELGLPGGVVQGEEVEEEVAAGWGEHALEQVQEGVVFAPIVEQRLPIK
jgi:hypothetical protein